MTLERPSEKSIRLTGFDSDNQIRIFLIMATPKEIATLYNAIDQRLNVLRQATKPSWNQNQDGPQAKLERGGDEIGDIEVPIVHSLMKKRVGVDSGKGPIGTDGGRD